MTATAADRRIQARNPGKLTPAKVKVSTTIYGGSLVARLTSDGLVQPATDEASITFAGVARERVVGNAAGTSKIELYQAGDFQFAFSGTASEATCGVAVYCVDDQTVALAATTTNDLAVGKVVEFLTASSVMVRITGYAF